MQRGPYIDPMTGGYTIINNSLVTVAPVVNKANVLLSMPTNTYLYAFNNGNPLLSTQGLLSRSAIVNGINTCLAPLLQNNSITSVEVLSIQLNEVFEYTVNIKIIYPSGGSDTLTWKR